MGQNADDQIVDRKYADRTKYRQTNCKHSKIQTDKMQMNGNPWKST